ncbi:antitoxin VbhA family protein [Actinomyces urinae]|uniref:antitoxin VbhA family protein n=1 Tax=Actinomyces urinae TaxID=1689268 RepID=UPI000930C8D9|nr:antitoxin VbhA family protein [Actinomyces urinae]
MRVFDIEQRWPELFQNLDERQRLGVRNTLAALWHEGFEATERDVENLTNYAAGIIAANEYRARAHATVGVYHGSEEAL